VAWAWHWGVQLGQQPPRGRVGRHRAEQVREVTFRAEPGRVTALVGPNAAGKSSTLRILLGLDRPTAGTALVGERPYRSLREPLRTVGSMLDGSGAHRSHTARGHLGWVARSNGIPGRRVTEVLDRVGLADTGRTRIGRFSLGMRQCLGLATALLGEPCREPWSMVGWTVLLLAAAGAVFHRRDA